MSSSTPIKTIESVTTSELYDRWARVYDTDGNILQAIDDLLFSPLLSQALSLLSSSSSLTITELGCGTGRNTIKLLSSEPNVQIGEIYALDLSPEMLALARKRCSAIPSTENQPKLHFHVFDALHPDPALTAQLTGKSNLVISTLVLEHLPLRTFFSTIATFLRPSSYLVLTNMHPDLGTRSRAGFTDPSSGSKIQGESYAHSVQETVDVGEEYGFEVVGSVIERAVGEEDVGVVVGERGKKWVGVGVWYGCVMRFGGVGRSSN